jgi:hypothetical protein
LFVDGDKFKIPKETYILAKNEIIFPNKITNLDVRKDSNIFLLFPNGEKATKFVKKNETILKNFSLDKLSNEEKKEVEIVLGIKNKKKNFIKKKSIKKKITKEVKVTKVEKDDYLSRNIFEEEKKDKKDVFNVLEKKGNFASQNFLSEETKKNQKLTLEKEENF